MNQVDSYIISRRFEKCFEMIRLTGKHFRKWKDVETLEKRIGRSIWKSLDVITKPDRKSKGRTWWFYMGLDIDWSRPGCKKPKGLNGPKTTRRGAAVRQSNRSQPLAPLGGLTLALFHCLQGPSYHLQWLFKRDPGNLKHTQRYSRRLDLEVML